MLRLDSAEMNMLTFDVGTIESIAMKTRDAFRDCSAKVKGKLSGNKL